MNVLMTLLICFVSGVMIVACVDMTASFFTQDEKRIDIE